jgi:hypothetical protein
MRCRAADTGASPFHRFLVNLGKCAASSCHDPGSLLRRVLHALDPAADRIGGLALSLYAITAIKACLALAVGTGVGLLGLRNPVHNTHGEMRPVGSAWRPFGEVSRAGTYFI